MDKKIVIAIDGWSSTGKSTVAKALAKQLGYIYVDTGAMYRAVTYFAMQSGFIDDNGNIDKLRLNAALPDIEITFRLNTATGAADTYLNGTCVEKEIRSIKTANNVSAVSAIPEVREAMVKQQQAMGKGRGIVMDGRDIATVVFPDAELKIFMTADPDIRAKRRYEELLSKGNDVTLDEVRKNVADRDFKDSNREISPLRQADDAVVHDNSNLTLEEQYEVLYRIAMDAIKKANE